MGSILILITELAWALEIYNGPQYHDYLVYIACNKHVIVATHKNVALLLSCTHGFWLVTHPRPNIGSFKRPLAIGLHLKNKKYTK